MLPDGKRMGICQVDEYPSSSSFLSKSSLMPTLVVNSSKKKWSGTLKRLKHVINEFNRRMLKAPPLKPLGL